MNVASQHSLIPARPIVIGSDTELGNFVLGMESSRGTGAVASKALLREIDGFASSASGSSGCNCDACKARRQAEEQGFSVSTNSFGGKSQDWGRKYLPGNGGCAYIDLDHLELCTPEVTSAFDFTAAWQAMLRIAQGALARVNAKAAKGLKVKAVVNNSDGQGNSYGGHLSFLVSRRLWDNLFHRKVHTSLYLAAHQASSIVYTGQGKVGAENDRPDVDYQISQRADFFETMQGLQTTFRRPILNCRDETLCGRTHGKESELSHARLHVIFYDANLAHTACVLKAGVMQLILAMLEQGVLDPSLILDDPLEAVVAWSHDPELTATARMANSQVMTAVDVQWKFFELAQQFAQTHGFDGFVPRADEILALWGETLDLLAKRDFETLASRVDWVLKKHALSRAMSRNPRLTWSSPELKHLDLLYGSLDPEEGLYWAYERAGVLDPLVSDEWIERYIQEPPEETRAWTRAKLMRLAGSEAVDNIDWDSIRFRVKGKRGWTSYPSLELGDPLFWKRFDAEAAFAGSNNLESTLAHLEALTSEENVTESAGDPMASSRST